MFNVDSKLFEIASRFASTEAARHYLRGVYVEPCESGGVALVATDGHRLFVAYDEKGEADKARIVRAEKPMLAQCKKAERLVCAGGESEGTDKNGNTVYRAETQTDGVFSGAGVVGFVDGTFPDWRRVVPSCKPHKSNQFDVFNGQYVADMGKAAIDLARREGLRDGFCRIVTESEQGSPALVEFERGPAFAVLMPARQTGSSVGLGLMDQINAAKEDA